MTPITPSLLAELKAKAERATQGEWQLRGRADIIFVQNSGTIAEAMGHDQKTNQKNAGYIAIASPTTILALIARVEELEAKLDAIESDYEDRRFY